MPTPGDRKGWGMRFVVAGGPRVWYRWVALALGWSVLSGLFPPGLPLAPDAAFAAGSRFLISKATDGTQGNYSSWVPSISADGRMVAFASQATNLDEHSARGDQIYLKNLSNDRLTLVSVTSAGTPGNEESGYPSISADGRHVAFVSRATNLVNNDTNGVADVFVKNLSSGAIERVSVGSLGQEANNQSAYMDGYYWDSTALDISANGRFVAFTSSATNLVPGDTNSLPDVFVRDRVLNVTSRISVMTGGVEAPRASSGRYLGSTSPTNERAGGTTASRSRWKKLGLPRT
jgi:Tol biopolymer transport system component